MKDKVCPNGISFEQNLCQAYPDKCADDAKKKDSYADNFYQMFVDRKDSGTICKQYPDLCFQDFKDGQDLIDNLCSDGFCVGKEPDLSKVCSAYSGRE